MNALAQAIRMAGMFLPWLLVLSIGCARAQEPPKEPAQTDVDEKAKAECTALAPANTSSEDIPCASSPAACEAWRRFRSVHPAPYQALAVSGDLGTGERVVIISEPPPTLTDSEADKLVAEVFRNVDGKAERIRYSTGLDGWLEDVVVRVRVDSSRLLKVSDGRGSFEQLPAALVDRLAFLHFSFHGTLDGFYVETINESLPERPQLKDLSVSAAEVNKWVRGANSKWRSPADKQVTGRTWAQVMSAPTSDAWLSEDGMLVALVIRPSWKPEQLAPAFRRFAVASDFLVGSIGVANGGFVLLGRSRQIPLVDLPPMRVESLTILLKNRGKPVVQSYERQRLFAGKIREGENKGWDWAPIKLSAHLEDSEFGTLLNLSDQVLKSWSECNHVAYKAFDYPARSFPFEDISASGLMSFLSPELIFNWNTRGFSTVAAMPVGKVVTSYRTGALPVSYIVPGLPAGKKDNAKSEGLRQLFADLARETTRSASEAGTQYFGGTGDPILARTVQYVFLLQSINEFLPGPAPSGDKTKSRSDLAVDVLRRRAQTWIDEVDKPTPEMDPRVAQALRTALRESGVPPARLVDLLAAPEIATREIIRIEAEVETQAAAFGQRIEAHEQLQVKLAEAARRSNAAFAAWCRARSGSLKEEGDRTVCRYQGRERLAEDSHYRDQDTDFISDNLPRYREYERDLETAEAAVKNLARARAQLVREMKVAEEVGDIVRSVAAYQASLDAILSEVLAAGARRPANGTLRTPTVVLSRNVANAGSVGGHNIDSKPWVANPAAGSRALFDLRGSQPSLQVPAGQIGNSTAIARAEVSGKAAMTTPPRPPHEALEIKAENRDNILDRMRRDLIAAEEPAAGAEVLKRAELCECDVYVERMAGETSTIVSMKPPPPVKRVVLGTSQVVEHLAGLSGDRRVIMAGYTPDGAGAIGQSAVNLSGSQPAARGTMFERLTNGVRALFGEARTSSIAEVLEGGGRYTIHAEVREGSVPQAKLAVLLREKQRWSGATIQGREGNQPGSELVEIRFRQRPGKPLAVESIDIVVAKGASSNVTVLPTVTNTVRSLGNSDVAIEAGAKRIVQEVERKLPSMTIEFVLKQPGIHKAELGGTWYARARAIENVLP